MRIYLQETGLMILRTIYFIINLLTTFEIKYFDVMYLLIAHVYIIASIFIIRTDIIKDATELKRIFEEQEKIKKEQMKEGIRKTASK